MERDLFEQRFQRATERAIEFARTFLEEPLPDATLFHVHLNSTYDGNATKAFKLFPEDSSVETAHRTKSLTADQVIDVLWRAGYVPQWVDVTVVGETGNVTVVEVMACGRFIDDESLKARTAAPRSSAR